MVTSPASLLCILVRVVASVMFQGLNVVGMAPCRGWQRNERWATRSARMDRFRMALPADPRPAFSGLPRAPPPASSLERTVPRTALSTVKPNHHPFKPSRARLHTARDIVHSRLASDPFNFAYHHFIASLALPSLQPVYHLSRHCPPLTIKPNQASCILVHQSELPLHDTSQVESQTVLALSLGSTLFPLRAITPSLALRTILEAHFEPIPLLLAFNIVQPN